MTNATTIPVHELATAQLQRVTQHGTVGWTQCASYSQSRDISTKRQHSAVRQVVMTQVMPLYAIHWPAMQARLSSKEMLDAFTREITRILTDGKVTTKQIEHALIQAPLRKYYPYPVPRDWLELCLEQQENGLPDVESVMACFHRYSADRLLYDSPERYPWPHPVMYWIVLDMRTAMKNRNLSEAELIQLAKRQLKTWSERVGLGEKIPAPVARITDNRRPPAPVRRFETQTSQMTGLAFRKAIQEKLSKVRANQ